VAVIKRQGNSRQDERKREEQMADLDNEIVSKLLHVANNVANVAGVLSRGKNIPDISL
jgi:hypothetical protein